ncbi:hypothetical protein FNW02_18495 [Komarekiella sp. 'clone 1']|uniref:Uncharacterized protein n=1 Tax=Komarekiella delphini-convector SJRDD-AB1 TaxID=2593771 RepID=A0AA40SYQ1_9NOST|nr:hypothetical protein [Komarekiella delphini-convector SJRDD-AB1]
MALAQHINIQDTKKVNNYLLWKILQLATTLLKQLWWHTKAYTTVCGIMLLTFVSIVFLYIHYLSRRNLTHFFDNETIVK